MIKAEGVTDAILGCHLPSIDILPLAQHGTGTSYLSVVALTIYMKNYLILISLEQCSSSVTTMQLHTYTKFWIMTG